MRQIQRVLGQLQEALSKTDAFIATLARLKLIEPIEVSLSFDDGERLNLQGLYTVSMDSLQSLADAVRARATLFRDPVTARSIVVPGSSRAERLDGLTHGDSPAEPQTLAIVFAVAGDELVTLSLRSWPRDDLGREAERVLASFEIIEARAPSARPAN